MSAGRLRTIVFLFVAAAIVFSMLRADEAEQATPAVVPPELTALADRAPEALDLSPDGTTVATANRWSGTVSLLNWQTGELLAEVSAGRQPRDVLWMDEQRLLITLQGDDSLAIVERQDGRWQLTRKIPLGDEPHHLAMSGGETPRLFVTLSGEDTLAVLDPRTWEPTGRLKVGGVPQSVAVTPDHKYVVTGCTVPGRVYVHRVDTLELVSQRSLFDQGFSLGRPAMLADSSQVIFPHPVNRTFPVDRDNIERGWVIDNRLSRLPLPGGEYWQQKQLGLDTRGAAAGDANAVAISPGEKWLAVACGGSHELLVLDYARLQWPEADPGDFIPYSLRGDDGLLRKIRLGGRPVDVLFADERHAVVANDFDNSVQVVDAERGRIVRRILLGGPAAPGLIRRGEMIFFDAERSVDSWFSCHTCHPHGHTSGQTFDTVNDGNYDTYKLVPSLRGVAHTAPWTWHGWQKTLSEAVIKSLHDTLSTPVEVADEDVTALLAYLQSLDHPDHSQRDNAGELTAAARRGQTLFTGKAGCVHCHAGEHFTTNATYPLGAVSNRYFYREFNPPSLRGLSSRRRFLHDGRADTVEEVLTRHHRPESTGGESLTDEERTDLMAFLRSL